MLSVTCIYRLINRTYSAVDCMQYTDAHFPTIYSGSFVECRTDQLFTGDLRLWVCTKDAAQCDIFQA